MKLTDTPTFGELCAEFDEENAKNPVYLNACEFLVRTVGGTMEGNINFLLSCCEKSKKGFRFEKNSDIYKHLAKRNTEEEIQSFEKKLSIFID